MLEADYLLIGAGASGMAFADALVHNTSGATLIIVDQHAKPGGHWNDAYDFITLHQPAAFYGVNSKQLGQGGKDLATFCEISAYYEHVMKDLLKSGRVKFFPQCEYKGDGVFRSMLARGLEHKVNVLKKIVDATYVGPAVPSTSKPDFEISNGVNFVAVNGLSHNKSAWKRYVIIGGGKTGVDAILFLLSQSVNPDQITWVIPNDYWFFNRDAFFPDNWCSANMSALNCVLNHKDYKELCNEWERVGYFLRLDTNVEPTRMKGATVTVEELENLRSVKDIVRKGRISRVEPTRIIFENGEEIGTDINTLHVDCSASGSTVFTPQKIFDGKNILLQDVKVIQSAYSASVVGVVESFYPENEEKKNEILKPIIHPQTPAEYVICLLKEFYNENAIGSLLGVNWFRKSRLHPIHHVSLFDFLRFMIYVKSNGEKLVEALENMVSSIESGNENS